MPYDPHIQSNAAQSIYAGASSAGRNMQNFLGWLVNRHDESQALDAQIDALYGGQAPAQAAPAAPGTSTSSTTASGDAPGADPSSSNSGGDLDDQYNKLGQASDAIGKLQTLSGVHPGLSKSMSFGQKQGWLKGMVLKATMAEHAADLADKLSQAKERSQIGDWRQAQGHRAAAQETQAANEAKADQSYFGALANAPQMDTGQEDESGQPVLRDRTPEEKHVYALGESAKVGNMSKEMRARAMESFTKLEGTSADQGFLADQRTVPGYTLVKVPGGNEFKMVPTDSKLLTQEVTGPDGDRYTALSQPGGRSAPKLLPNPAVDLSKQSEKLDDHIRNLMTSRAQIKAAAASKFTSADTSDLDTEIDRAQAQRNAVDAAMSKLKPAAAPAAAPGPAAAAPAGAIRYPSLPAKDADLKVGQPYMTARGPARWNGKGFEKIKP